MLLADPGGGHILPEGQAPGLSDQRSDVCARILISLLEQLLDVDIICQGRLFQMDLEDLAPGLAVRHGHQYQLIEPSRPEKSRIDDIRPVGRSDHHHSVQLLQAVHLA